MKRIIALYGKANIGKSHTLRMLIEIIAEEIGQKLEHKESLDKKYTFIVNNKTVCICPAGDNEEELRKAIDYVKKKNFDIAILGSRTKGAPVKAICSLAEDFNIDVEWRLCPDTIGWPNDLRTEIQITTAKMLFRLLD